MGGGGGRDGPRLASSREGPERLVVEGAPSRPCLCCCCFSRLSRSGPGFTAEAAQAPEQRGGACALRGSLCSPRPSGSPRGSLRSGAPPGAGPRATWPAVGSDPACLGRTSRLCLFSVRGSPPQGGVLLLLPVSGGPISTTLPVGDLFGWGPVFFINGCDFGVVLRGRELRTFWLICNILEC